MDRQDCLSCVAVEPNKTKNLWIFGEDLPFYSAYQQPIHELIDGRARQAAPMTFLRNSELWPTAEKPDNCIARRSEHRVSSKERREKNYADFDPG